MDNLSKKELLEELAELKFQLKSYKEFDLLTGLYNKNTFYEKIREQLNSYPDKKFQIFCVDIERFKMVNDLCGSEKGDELLQHIAGELKLAFGGPDTVMGRIAADIYGICLPADISAEEVEKRVLEIFNDCPFGLHIMPAIGLYIVENKSLAVELMCDRAILALNTIKGNYMNHLAIYNSKLRNVLIEEHEIINRADKALANGEFQLYMQPKCNMKTGKIAGAEVLVRWNHPQKGIVAPGAFIPAFEKNGFIKKLDLYIWEETARWLSKRKKDGLRILPISVNVSRVDILSMDVDAVFQSLVEHYDIDPSYLEVEVTESAYTSRPDKIIQAIEGLMNHGFTVLMDDFGSGYSSLNLLKDINIDMLKLDMRFLDNTNRKSRDILESVVHMARWLKLRVIAEGVESENQEEFLLNIGCEYAQGFYYYRPMPLKAFEKLLDNSENVEEKRYQKYEDTELSVINFKELFHMDVMTEQLMNHILGAIALYDYDGTRMNILRCNEEYCHMVWHDRIPEDLAKYNAIETVIEEDRPYLKKALTEAKERGDKGSEIYVRRNISGQETTWLLARLFFLSAVNGKNIYYGAVSDVTDQMQAVEALRMSEQRFRIAMEATGDVMFELDIAGRTAYYTKSSMEAFELSDCKMDAPEGFIRQGFVCPGYEKPFRKLYEDIYEGADRASCEICAHTRGGGIIWSRITIIAVKDKTGKSVNAVGLMEDITREISLKQQLDHQKQPNQTETEEEMEEG